MKNYDQSNIKSKIMEAGIPKSVLLGVVIGVTSFAIIDRFYIPQVDSSIDCFLLNLIFLAIIIMLGAILYRNDHLHKIENISKDRILKIINKINQIKLSVTNTDDLIDLICTKLEEDLGAKFKIILVEEINSLEPNKDYNNKALEILHKMVPDIIFQKTKTIYFQPIHTVHRPVGVLIIDVDKSKRSIFNLKKILSILSDQIAIIIDNYQTRLKLGEAKINEEKEKLRSLILSSISHDLKTPLSSIICSLRVRTNLSNKNKLTKKNEETLIAAALEESERLNGFISDVLEMTRIESGALKLRKQFFNPTLIIKKTLKRFKKELRGYNLDINISKEVEINFDKTCFGQIIQNLIDNTVKYSFKNTTIRIWDEFANGIYRIFIQDEGRGIEKSKLHLIFNKFERFAFEDKLTGIGLGLSIVKALMEINNAAIIAQNAKERTGVVFILEFKDFTLSNLNQSS